MSIYIPNSRFHIFSTTSKSTKKILKISRKLHINFHSINRHKQKKSTISFALKVDHDSSKSSMKRANKIKKRECARRSINIKIFLFNDRVHNNLLIQRVSPHNLKIIQTLNFFILFFFFRQSHTQQ